MMLSTASPALSEPHPLADRVCAEQPWNARLTQKSWDLQQRALQLYGRIGLPPRVNLFLVREDASAGLPQAIACNGFKHIVVANPSDAEALSSDRVQPSILLAYWAAVIMAEAGRDTRTIENRDRIAAQAQAANRLRRLGYSIELTTEANAILENRIKQHETAEWQRAFIKRQAEKLANAVRDFLVSPAEALPYDRNRPFDGMVPKPQWVPQPIRIVREWSAKAVPGLAFHGEAEDVGGILMRGLTADQCIARLVTSKGRYRFAEFVLKSNGTGHCGLLPGGVRLERGPAKANPVYEAIATDYRIVASR
jgi:hypothetical protein